ncbi:hypothetical protein K3495_g4647 [Podosphaera aphanis]|nr:hypothetical protein K3495_g4647 [Podosphaera aphanis]
MENNPWNPEGTGIPPHHPQSHASQIDRFNDRDATFVQKYPLLCSVPNPNLFIQAIQNGIPGNSTVQLSEEIIKLATAYVNLEGESFKLKDDYDTLLEKNHELLDANTKFQKQKKAAEPSSSQLQQQVANLQQ